MSAPAAATSTATGPGVVRDLVELTKPRITGLVIATTGGGLWLAPGDTPWGRIIATVLGTVLVVGAANTLNNYMERESDRFMARTRNRPLPAGRLNPRFALILGAVLALISVPMLTFLVNPLTGLLATIALVTYVAAYTPMKQMTPSALYVGAIAGAMPPLIGWTAVTGRVDMPGLVLFGILFVWQVPHFIAISLYREAEYSRAGIKTMPALYGPVRSKGYALLWTGALVPISLALMPLGVAGPIYAVFAGVLGIIFVRWSLSGFRLDAEDTVANARWARGYFFYSLIYLTLLFAALVLDGGA
ncbi:MAG: heme o synthase [Planctomycetota bacterium]|jgi:protoheme IX farnesyltransferase